MKKIIISSVLILTFVFGLAATAGVASAKNSNSYYKNFGQMMKEIKSKVLSNVSKNNTIIGSVTSTTGNTIKINVKNKEYTVNIDTANSIIVNRLWDKISLSSIQVKDTVNVYGTKTDTTINAKLVRDLSVPVQTEIDITGTVLSLTSTTSPSVSGTLKVRAYSKEYTVNVESGDIVVNKLWDKINLNDIKVNDRVSIFGITTASTTINAKVVRDISLPLTTEDED